MEIVSEGIKVKIMFEAKLETGETVLKTEEEKPVELIVGEGKIPITIEKALIDMKVGETKTIKLEPVEAFGPKLDNLIIDLPKEGFKPANELEVGSKVSINSPDGKQFMGFILEIQSDTIKVDFNHPLAGKSIEFTVTVISVD